MEFGMLLTMYRVTLTNEQRTELRQRTRQRGLAPSTRDRLEMVRLADAGWSAPRIARHLGQHEQTVRAWLKAFLDRGFDALVNQPRGGKHSALTPAILDAVRAEIAKAERTWTAAQLTCPAYLRHPTAHSTVFLEVAPDGTSTIGGRDRPLPCAGRPHACS